MGFRERIAMSLIATAGSESFWVLMRRMAEPVVGRVTKAVDHATTDRHDFTQQLAGVPDAAHLEEDAERWDGLS